MSIWFNKNLRIEDFFDLEKGTMADYIGIKWVELGENFVKATMPVDHRTIQPYGLLHGGASCVLAETIGSVASAMVVDHSKFLCYGLEISASHIRGIKVARTNDSAGQTTAPCFVTAVATPYHLGSSTHVWDIKIRDEKEKLLCVSRLTVAIISRKE